jgi:hypothetical protein
MLQKQPPAKIAVCGFAVSGDMGAAINAAAAEAKTAINKVILFIEGTSS